MALPSASNKKKQKTKQNKTKHTTLLWLFHLPLGNQHLPNVVLTSTTTSGNKTSLEN